MLFLPVTEWTEMDQLWYDSYIGAWAKWSEAVQALWQEIAKIMGPVMDQVLGAVVTFHRDLFADWLTSHHIPSGLASWLAQHWPLRWLLSLERLFPTDD